MERRFFRGLVMAGLVILHFSMRNGSGIPIANAAEMISDGVDITIAGEQAETFFTDMEMEENQEIFTENQEVSLENPEIPREEEINLCADFQMTVTEDIPVIKAGESVGYEIVLENTGNLDLENVILRSIVDDGRITGEWLETNGTDKDAEAETLSLSLLEAGTSKTLVYMINVPEDRVEKINAEFLARAENPQKSMESEEILSDAGIVQEKILSRSVSLSTEIVPLLVEFQVSKWADRKMAVPGDTIRYQICIRNTGERILHSVLTTEKFQTAGLKARFLEKDGVILNGEKTEALIAEIKPQEAFGLYAEVTLPENFEGSELLNEVTVVTRETGKQEYQAQSQISVLEPVKSSDVPVQQKEEWIPAADTGKEIPQTEDLSETELWAGSFGITCLIITGIYWIRKAKRKR